MGCTLGIAEIESAGDIGPRESCRRCGYQTAGGASAAFGGDVSPHAAILRSSSHRGASVPENAASRHPGMYCDRFAREHTGSESARRGGLRPARFAEPSMGDAFPDGDAVARCSHGIECGAPASRPSGGPGGFSGEFCPPIGGECHRRAYCISSPGRCRGDGVATRLWYIILLSTGDALGAQGTESN